MPVFSTHVRIRRLLNSPSEEDCPASLIDHLRGKQNAWLIGMLSNIYPTLTSLVAPFPELLVSWEEDMTAYAVLKHPEFRMRQGVDTAMVEQARTNAVEDVKAAARRKMRVPGLTARDSSGSSTETINRTFGMDDPEKWCIDPDTLRKVANTRTKE